MTSVRQGSAPVKPNTGTAGEREFLIHALRTAVARARLATNALETIGVSLRHNRVSCDQAMEWLKEEGLLDHVQFGPAVSP